MTIEVLNEFGADTAEGLARCMGNEEFYLKMVELGLADERFDTLRPILEAHNLDDAFEMCHALKGVFGNLSLTELLRARTEMDYLPMFDEIRAERDRLLAMAKEKESTEG